MVEEKQMITIEYANAEAADVPVKTPSESVSKQSIATLALDRATMTSLQNETPSHDLVNKILDECIQLSASKTPVVTKTPATKLINKLLMSISVVDNSASRPSLGNYKLNHLKNIYN